MILNTGSRTDIPAFFSDWFYNRVREGFCMARNPFYPEQVTRYRLSPDVVDCLVFCTKNPGPALGRLPELAGFGQLWYVTVTPYGKEVEPFVPEKKQVLESFRRLSEAVGSRAVVWRYDPVFVDQGGSPGGGARGFCPETEELTCTHRPGPEQGASDHEASGHETSDQGASGHEALEQGASGHDASFHCRIAGGEAAPKYTVEFHLEAFERMAAFLAGYTEVCVISFIDLYEKTKRNFPGIQTVPRKDQILLGKEFARIGRKYGIRIKSCCEGTLLEPYGVDCAGCMTKEAVERAIDCRLNVPKNVKPAREGCTCLLGSDIGAYNTCGHGCRYCYANYDQESVRRNRRLHDPKSPFLIGWEMEGDVVREARQESWKDRQMRLEDFGRL